jgi:hypothetical protein
MTAASKGSGPVTAKYAQGGEVLTQRSRFAKESIYGATPEPGKSRFLKVPDTFRTNEQKTDYGAKYDPLCKPEGETKVEKAIKPRT